MSLPPHDSAHPSLAPGAVRTRPVFWDRLQTRRGLLAVLIVGALLGRVGVLQQQSVWLVFAIILGAFGHISAAYSMWKERCFHDWGWRLLSMGGALLVVDSLFRLVLSR